MLPYADIKRIRLWGYFSAGDYIVKRAFIFNDIFDVSKAPLARLNIACQIAEYKSSRAERMFKWGALGKLCCEKIK